MFLYKCVDTYNLHKGISALLKEMKFGLSVLHNSLAATKSCIAVLLESNPAADRH